MTSSLRAFLDVRLNASREKMKLLHICVNIFDGSSLNGSSSSIQKPYALQYVGRSCSSHIVRLLAYLESELGTHRS